MKLLTDIYQAIYSALSWLKTQFFGSSAPRQPILVEAAGAVPMPTERGPTLPVEDVVSTLQYRLYKQRLMHTAGHDTGAAGIEARAMLKSFRP